jgi:hypothetical protein
VAREALVAADRQIANQARSRGVFESNRVNERLSDILAGSFRADVANTRSAIDGALREGSGLAGKGSNLWPRVAMQELDQHAGPNYQTACRSMRLSVRMTFKQLGSIRAQTVEFGQRGGDADGVAIRALVAEQQLGLHGNDHATPASRSSARPSSALSRRSSARASRPSSVNQKRDARTERRSGLSHAAHHLAGLREPGRRWRYCVRASFSNTPGRCVIGGQVH